eukprot:1186480-Prorocentrum_minimum.AAC.10
MNRASLHNVPLDDALHLYVAAEPGTPGYPALRAKGTKIPTGFGSHEPVLSIEGFAVLRYVSTLEHTGSILRYAGIRALLRDIRDIPNMSDDRHCNKVYK